MVYNYLRLSLSHAMLLNLVGWLCPDGGKKGVENKQMNFSGTTINLCEYQSKILDTLVSFVALVNR